MPLLGCGRQDATALRPMSLGRSQCYSSAAIVRWSCRAELGREVESLQTSETPGVARH